MTWWTMCVLLVSSAVHWEVALRKGERALWHSVLAGVCFGVAVLLFIWEILS